MERHVKERLVGAAVLVAAAVILIPELLSGPRHATTAAAPVLAGEAPIKTYTIDLNRSPDAPAAVEESAPPPEASEPIAANETSPAPTPAGPGQGATTDAQPSAAVDAPVTASSAEPATANPPSTVPTPKPATAKPTQTKPESAPGKPAAARDNALALTSTVPNSQAATAKQWAVQLGSFASKANAERLVKEWEGRGQHGMMAPVKAASGTLYRVRLGPFADRAAADEALRKVKPTISGAAVVAHP